MRITLITTSSTAMFMALVLFLWPLMTIAEDVVGIDDINVRYLYVQPGQTLHNIVTRLYPTRKPEWPKIANDIVRINPHAFVEADATRMKAGVRLELPHRQVVIKTEVLNTKALNTKELQTKIKHVGAVLISRGQVLAVSPDSKARILIAGDHVFVGDKLITGADGFLRLQMIDQAVLDLRCYSIMVIEDYAIKSTSGTNRSVLNLLKGSLKKVTGDIGKWQEDVYQLNTPVASIGVRGTEYALRVYQSKGCDGTIDLDDDGLYLEVMKGLVDVSNAAGVTTVALPDTIYIPRPGSAPVDKKVAAGIIYPAVQESSNLWWYLLGVIALALVL